MNKYFDFQNNQANKFLFISSVLLLLLSALLFINFENQHEKAVLADVQQTLSLQAEQDSTVLEETFKNNVADVRFLANTPPISGIIRAAKNDGYDQVEDTTLSLWQQRLSQIFYEFMSSQSNIAQIRYIGKANEGMELVRVEKQHGTGASRIILHNALQAKADRNYFQQTAKLGNGQIYISDINLNREHGRLDYPLWPTYRVSTPIYDDQGEFFGIVIINYNAQQLINQFQVKLAQNMLLYILNTEGEYLSHPQQNKAFSFETGLASTSWSEDFSVFADTEKMRLLQTADDEQLYAIEKQVSLNDTNRFIRLVLAMQKDDVSQLIADRRFASMFTLMLIIAIGGVIILIYRKILVKQVDLSFAQSQYAALIEGSRDAILTVTTDGMIDDWNDATFEILRIPPFSLANRHLVDIVDSKGQSSLGENLDACLAGSKVPSTEIITHIASGELLALSVVLSPIHDNQDNIIGASTIIRDITEQILVKQDLENLNLSLEQQVELRTEELQKATQEAVEASQMKSSFVANVSHEIRTPLNGIIGMHNLMRSGELDNKQSSYLEMATHSAKSLLMLINDILDLSKIEAGKLDIEKQPLNLIDNFSQAANSMSARALDKNVEIVLDIADIKHPVVIGDGLRLRQILNNLISNAIKFTERGEIVISASTTVDTTTDQIKLQASVKDSGVGIEKDKLNTLFKAFSQEDVSTTRRYGGTGLGLSIVSNLCHLMGGNCHVTSEKGTGSTFSFDLTLSASDRNTMPLENIINLNNFTIQVVEKRDSVRDSLNKLLLGWGAKTVLSDEPDMEDVDIVISQLGQNGIDDETVAEQLQHLAENEYDGQFIFTLTFKQRHSLDDLNTKIIYQVIHRPILPIQLATALSQLTAQPVSPFLSNEENNRQASTTQLTEFKDVSVLVVDDNEINQRVAAGILEHYALDVHLASNGVKAIELLKHNPDIQLILMDCQMPVMDGFSTTDAIRRGDAGNHYKKVPIIAMTAGAMTGDREECLGAGMNDYLTKPIAPDELQGKVSLWLQARSAQKKTAILSPVNIESVKAEKQPQSAQAEQTDTQFWDRKASLDRLLSNEDLFMRMLEMFEQQTPSLIEEIDQHFQQKAFGEIRKNAHKLKGSASAIGANSVLNAARELENAAIEEQYDEAVVAYESVKQETQRMFEAISDYQSQAPDVKSTSS